MSLEYQHYSLIEESKNPERGVIPLLVELYTNLPKIAQELIEIHQDSIADSESFYKDPDGVMEHQPRYHQHGAITHPRKVFEAYLGEGQDVLSAWGKELPTLGLDSQISDHLSKQIDGISKGDLLAVATLTHDLGKYALRKRNGSIGYSFVGHEEKSGEIIKGYLAPMLRECLTENQIEYIAQCSKLHYKLGELRRYNGSTYSQNYLQSDEFKQSALAIMEEYPDYTLEIGLFYLIDSLGKTDIRISPEVSDEEILRILHDKGFCAELLTGIRQVPINVLAAHEYLMLWQKKQK